MPLISLLTVTFCAFLIATFFSMFGLGGGALYTPLFLLFDHPFEEAVTISLLMITVGSLCAAIIYSRAKLIDWPLVIVLQTFAASGAFSSGYFADLFPEIFLRILFAGITTFTGISMIRSRSGKSSQSKPKFAQGAFFWKRNRKDGVPYGVNLLFGAPVMFFIGAFSGLVGVGGGVFTVPFLVFYCGAPIELAIGCSAAMACFIGLSGFLGHSLSGPWELSYLLFALAVAIGGILGARRSIRTDVSLLKRIFGFVLLGIAIFVIVQ